jgi:RNA polymerase sigma-70 factor (ECF subfamily)
MSVALRPDRGAEELERLRRAAFGAAYRMLGVHAEAEEASQEALARLLSAEPAPESPTGWVIAVATRLSIDILRSARLRRETYIGPWLPEPDLAIAPTQQELELELAESVSLALMIVLETLSPAERAAFLLHDVFGFAYREIAAILERSEAAARQLVSRARRAVDARRSRFEPDPQARARVADAFVAACAEGEIEGLLAVLAEDVVMRSDGGGTVQAARKPILGAARVARAIIALRRHQLETAAVTGELVTINGTPGVLILEDGVPASLMGIDVTAGHVSEIHVIREPGKLAAALATLPREH